MAGNDTYAQLQRAADNLLSRYGLKATLTRDGAPVGSGWAIFVERKDSLDSSEPLAHTTVKTRQLKLTGLIKEPRIGDMVTADKQTFTVVSVEAHRPTSTTLAYTLEVS